MIPLDVGFINSIEDKQNETAQLYQKEMELIRLENTYIQAL